MSSNFLQFNSGLANSLTDAAYTSSTQRTGGLTSGIASSALHNKLFCQSSTMAYSLGQALANSGFTILDSNATTLTSAIAQLWTPGVNAQTGTTYTIAATDRKLLVTFNNASAVSVTLPPPSTANFGSYYEVELANIGVGTVTVNCTAQIDGVVAAVTIATGQSIKFRSDNTNYWTSRGRGSIAAVKADQTTGTSTTTYVNPGVQQYHASATKAWFLYQGTGTPAILASYNVSSITRNGTGDYTANFTTAFSTANYAGNISGGHGSATGAQITTHAPFTQAPTTTTFRFGIFNNSGILADFEFISGSFFGAQ